MKTPAVPTPQNGHLAGSPLCSCLPASPRAEGSGFSDITWALRAVTDEPRCVHRHVTALFGLPEQRDDARSAHPAKWPFGGVAALRGLQRRLARNGVVSVIAHGP